MGVDIEDSNSALKYSGSWSTYSASSQSGGSGRSTTSSGASVTFTFEGTGLRMYCTVPAGHDLTSQARVNFDGVVRDLSHNTHPSDFYNDNWFDTGAISNGRHTITVTNTGSGTPFILDRFNIDGSSVNVAPPAPPPAPSPSPTPKPTTATVTSTEVVTSTSVSISDVRSSSTTSGSLTASSSATSSNTSSGQSSSQTGTHSDTALGQKTVTAVQYITTAPDGTISTQTGLPIDSNSSDLSSPHLPLGAIVGIAIGGLILLLVLLFLVIFLRRRRRRGHLMLQEDQEANETLRPRVGLTYNNASRLARNQSSSQGHGMRAEAVGRVSESASSSPSPTTPMGISEKSADIYAHPSPGMHPTHSSYDTRSTLPEINTGSNTLRPRYMSGDTIPGAPSSMYAPAMLSQVDTNDFPPSYQSVRNPNSGANRGSTITNSIS